MQFDEVAKAWIAPLVTNLGDILYFCMPPPPIPILKLPRAATLYLASFPHGV